MQISGYNIKDEHLQIAGGIVATLAFFLLIRWGWKKLKAKKDGHTDLPDGGDGLPDPQDIGWVDDIASSLDSVLNNGSKPASEMELVFQKYYTLAGTNDAFVMVSNHYNQTYAPEDKTLTDQMNGWGTFYACFLCSSEWRDKVRAKLKKLNVQ